MQHQDVDNDIIAFANTVPPPPYPGLRGEAESSGAGADAPLYDLTPTPHALNRPRLPEEKRNPHLHALPDDVTLVKFQTIVRDNREIVVGRIKVPTGPINSNSHAFILRRYDTNAISLTTMYKVAFPGASEEDERREMEWIKSSYDTRNTNGGRGSDVVRLAGQWVSRHLAIHLAPAYHITDLVSALARAVPDPNVAYRKSQRSQAAADEMVRQRDTRTVPAPPITNETTTPVPKRQRVSSPNAQMPSSDNEQRHLTLEATTTVTAPNNVPLDVEAEIQSAKQLVLDLKRELRLRAAVGEDLEDQGIDVGESSRGTKRSQGDEGVVISGGTSKERVIKRNKRVEQSAVGDTAKKVAWGALLFGLGVGATFLPNIF